MVHWEAGAGGVGPLVCPDSAVHLPLAGLVVVVPLRVPHKAERSPLEAVLCQTR